MQEYGGLVLAQDEATSVIFGMPFEAIRTGAVHQVLPLEQIAAAITWRLTQPQARRGWRDYERFRQDAMAHAIKENSRPASFLSRRPSRLRPRRGR